VSRPPIRIPSLFLIGSCDYSPGALVDMPRSIQHENELGRNIDILLAWISLSSITITVTTWMFRKNSVNAHRVPIAESEVEEKPPESRGCS